MKKDVVSMAKKSLNLYKRMQLMCEEFVDTVPATPDELSEFDEMMEVITSYYPPNVWTVAYAAAIRVEMIAAIQQVSELIQKHEERVN